jgi:hypothetical protein
MIEVWSLMQTGLISERELLRRRRHCHWRYIIDERRVAWFLKHLSVALGRDISNLAFASYQAYWWK